ncbi:MAG TPA: DUF962 domain-containing protein [Candidatus Dormibacteraeota bacterium]|nr:DUF962 domain-containing protein [Candidatus Dormibacteraeota bacterium]
MESFENFEGFFRYYISQHSKPATRWVHFASTHAGILVGLTALVRRKPLLLLAAPVTVYGPAFLSHYLIEKNSPVTLKGNPFWAMRGDLRMISTMWRGRDAELGRIAREELERTADLESGITIRINEETAAAAS